MDTSGVVAVLLEEIKRLKRQAQQPHDLSSLPVLRVADEAARQDLAEIKAMLCDLKGGLLKVPPVATTVASAVTPVSSSVAAEAPGGLPSSSLTMIGGKPPEKKPTRSRPRYNGVRNDEVALPEGMATHYFLRFVFVALS